jgi:hypothetical protein
MQLACTRTHTHNAAPTLTPAHLPTQKTKGKRQKTKDKRHKTKDKRQKTKDERRKTKYKNMAKSKPVEFRSADLQCANGTDDQLD